MHVTIPKKVTIDDEVRDLGCFVIKHVLEEFEDTKRVIRIGISKKNRKHNGQRKSTNGQTTIYKAYTKNERTSNTNPAKNRIYIEKGTCLNPKMITSLLKC